MWSWWQRDMVIANFFDSSTNQFVAIAAAEKLAAFDLENYFRSRVARADTPAFDRTISRAGGVPPREGDER